jgi:hypothetical protein
MKTKNFLFFLTSKNASILKVCVNNHALSVHFHYHIEV